MFCRKSKEPELVAAMMAELLTPQTEGRKSRVFLRLLESLESLEFGIFSGI
jgi:hypothetical protein